MRNRMLAVAWVLSAAAAAQSFDAKVVRAIPADGKFMFGVNLGECRRSALAAHSDWDRKAGAKSRFGSINCVGPSSSLTPGLILEKAFVLWSLGAQPSPRRPCRRSQL